MDKPFLSVQLVESCLLDTEILMKNMRLNLRLQYGACNGAQSQINMILPSVLSDAGIKHFIILTVMGRKSKSSVKGAYLAIQFQSTFIIQGNTF